MELVAVDFSEKSDKKVSKQLMKQMTTVGFCLITNVPGHDEDKLLEAIKAFHAVSDKDKMKLALNHYNRKNKNIYHGYFPFLKNDVAHKEFYQLGRPLSDYSEWEKQDCPFYHDTPWFANAKKLGLDDVMDVYKEHWDRMHQCCMRILRCLSMGLGKSPDYFDPWFAEECSSVWRGIHYKPRPSDQKLDDPRLQKLTAPEHRDSGFITLLSTFMYPGLQVEYDGKFRDVKGAKNAIVVNLGATL